MNNYEFCSGYFFIFFSSFCNVLHLHHTESKPIFGRLEEFFRSLFSLPRKISVGIETQSPRDSPYKIMNRRPECKASQRYNEAEMQQFMNATARIFNIVRELGEVSLGK